MKRFFIIAALGAACLLTACGEENTAENNDLPETAAVTSVTASAETSVNTAETAVSSAVTTTTVVTTEADPKKIPDEVNTVSLDEVEVYSDITLRELLAGSNYDIQQPDMLLDTSDVGTFEVAYTFDYRGRSYENTITYDVVDTTPPLCINSGWNPYVKAGTTFDPNEIVGFADNYDPTPVITYSGTVDTSAIGEYPVTMYVTDSFGNQTSWDVTVYVVSEIPPYQDNNARLNFQDFMDKYCYENVSYGIDVSAWQTNVDYNTVRDQGCEFVIMRMGYCYGEIKKDDYYEQNMQRATAAGLDVGVYFYTTANTEEKARQQARWIVQQLGGRQLDYPIGFDWEEWSKFQQYNMSIHDINKVFEAFCDELEQNGYTGMLYSSKNFLNNIWENKNNRTVWLAHYVDETDYSGTFAIWQVSGYGRMNGINGDVDLNIRIKDVPVY